MPQKAPLLRGARPLRPELRPRGEWTKGQLPLDTFWGYPDSAATACKPLIPCPPPRLQYRPTASWVTGKCCHSSARGASWKSWPGLLWALPPRPCREGGRDTGVGGTVHRAESQVQDTSEYIAESFTFTASPPPPQTLFAPVSKGAEDGKAWE